MQDILIVVTAKPVKLKGNYLPGIGCPKGNMPLPSSHGYYHNLTIDVKS